MATISCALICRNGARTLERLISSIRPHVDEISIYLGGESSDGTPEILAHFADEPGAPLIVEQGVWSDDYSAARTASFAMSTCDYLLVADDDEIFEGGQNLHALLEDGPDVLYVRRADIFSAEAVTSCFAMRVIRRGLGVWRGRVHEELIVPLDSSALVVSPAVLQVLHHPLRAPGRHDYGDTIAAALEREPTRKLLTALAVTKAQAGDYEAACVLLERAIDPAEPLPPVDETGPMTGTFEMGVLQHLSFWRQTLGDKQGAIDATIREHLLACAVNRANPLNAETAW